MIYSCISGYDIFVKEMALPTRTSKPTTVSALAQQFVAANPETIEVANDRTNWPGVRRPLAAARALLQFADLGEALRKAAEEYIKTRGGRGYQQEGFRARFAAQLCEAAGVPFCKRCGRYLTDRPHSPCPFDAFQAALLGLPSLTGSQPAYFGLDKATRQALRSACAPIATSPRIDKDLSGIAGGLLYFLEKDTDSPYRSYQRRVLAISLTEIITRLRTAAEAIEATLNLVEDAL